MMPIFASIGPAVPGLAAVPAPAQIALARGGQAQFAIVCSVANQLVLGQAVIDLHHYLAKVTGADFRTAASPACLVILDQPPTRCPTCLADEPRSILD